MSTIIIYLQISYSYTQIDTRIEAANWIKSAGFGENSIGNNEFCSGESPASTAGLNSTYDPFFKGGLDFYVINSYWDSPCRDKYLEKGILTQSELNRIHFEQWNSTKLFGGFGRVLVEDADFPQQYHIIKEFHGNGPDIFVLKKR
jgi:hypothetical protein